MSRRQYGTVRKLPSGKWQARYWDDTRGEQRSAPTNVQHQEGREPMACPTGVRQGQRQIGRIEEVTGAPGRVWRTLDRRPPAPPSDGGALSAPASPPHRSILHISATSKWPSSNRPTSGGGTPRWCESPAFTRPRWPSATASSGPSSTPLSRTSYLPPSPAVFATPASNAPKNDRYPRSNKSLRWPTPSPTIFPPWSGLPASVVSEKARSSASPAATSTWKPTPSRSNAPSKKSPDRAQSWSIQRPRAAIGSSLVLSPLLRALDEHLAAHVAPGRDALLFTNSRDDPVRATVWVNAWSHMRRSTGLKEARLP